MNFWKYELIMFLNFDVTTFLNFGIAFAYMLLRNTLLSIYTCQIHYLWILFYKICELYLYINEHFTVFLRFNRIFNISLLKSSIWEHLILVELLFYGCTSTKTTFICNLSNKLHIIFNHFLFLLKTFNVSFPFMIRTLAHIWTLLTWKWENNLPWIYMP